METPTGLPGELITVDDVDDDTARAGWNGANRSGTPG